MMALVLILAVLSHLKIGNIAPDPSIQRVIKQANWLASQGRGEQGVQLLETRMCVSGS